MIFSHGTMADKLNEYDPFISADKDAERIIENAESLPDKRYNAEQLYETLKPHLPEGYKGRVFLQACEMADVNWERDRSGKCQDSFAGSLGREFARAGQKNVEVKGRFGSPSLENDRAFLVLDSEAWKTRVEHDEWVPADKEKDVASRKEVPEKEIWIKSAENEYFMPEPSSPSESSGPLDGSNSTSEREPELPNELEPPNEPEPPNELERPGGPEGPGPELGPGPER